MRIYKTPKTFQEAVDILDDYSPNWFNIINLDDFEMDNIHKCVLGQIAISVGLQNANDLRSELFGCIFWNDIEPFYLESYECHWINIIKTRRRENSLNQMHQRDRNDTGGGVKPLVETPQPKVVITVRYNGKLMNVTSLKDVPVGIEFEVIE